MCSSLILSCRNKSVTTLSLHACTSQYHCMHAEYKFYCMHAWYMKCSACNVCKVPHACMHQLGRHGKMQQWACNVLCDENMFKSIISVSMKPHTVKQSIWMCSYLIFSLMNKSVTTWWSNAATSIVKSWNPGWRWQITLRRSVNGEKCCVHIARIYTSSVN
jgi:hypothetical protein